jgi:formylglycine-generating enzyme required for sulfatase activity
MKKVILVYFFFLSYSVFGQTISVSSFKLLDTDLTANTAGTMEMDQNGETAALIKVVTTQTGFTFDGGALGIVKTVQKPSEIWVYVPRGLKKITISHPQLGMLRDYYLNIPIEAARTYEMILIAGEIQTVVKQARTSQYVVFQLTPPNAVVELNGELLETNEGTATKAMKFGTYNYRVQAPNYLPEAGNVTINDPQNKHVVNITLQPNFTVVTLNVDNNAEIWINGEHKGTGSWTGNLGPGTYIFEAKKENHRDSYMSRDIAVTSEPQTIILQAPTPILGEADINSSPAMADIYIDGKKVGQTPQMVSDLLVGQHSVRISKQGFTDYNSTITVKEGEPSTFKAKLEKSKADQTIATSSNANQMISVGNVSFTMVRVEGGSFQMGATSEQGSNIDSDEKPAHQVTLSPYYIGETEVTQSLWETVMDNNPSSFKDSNKPVENVSWNDCQEFIQKLNQKTGRKFRLPTEAEWEFAARGGNRSNGNMYSGSNNINEVAWFVFTTERSTCDVKQKKANELGAYDMSGNVQEWCQDWHEHYSAKSVKNPKGPKEGVLRVFRGGGWNLLEHVCTVVNREYARPDTKRDNIGLRLAFDNVK